MRFPQVRWPFVTITVGALLATTAAHADESGTPTQPPAALPSTQPLTRPDAQPPLQSAPPAASYRAYPQRREQKSHWYGWQTLIVDGGWLVAGTATAFPAPEAGAAVILVGYLLGPPIVHWGHGQVGRGFVSLGIRAGAPLVLGAIGYAAFQQKGGGGFVDEGAVGAVLFAGLGVIGAIVVDATALAYESHDDDDDEAVRRAPQRSAILPASLTPLAVPRSEGGFLLGLSGTLY